MGQRYSYGVKLHQRALLGGQNAYHKMTIMGRLLIINILYKVCDRGQNVNETFTKFTKKNNGDFQTIGDVFGKLCKSYAIPNVRGQQLKVKQKR